MTEDRTINNLRMNWLRMNLAEPRVIWEIGSRDGREAQRLSNVFADSRILAFEPNPDTYPLVEAEALRNPRIISKNWAISNETAWIDFHKINTKETITSWADGNPGASSLLRSSGKYPHEKYVQEVIKVQSIRAADYLEENPDLKPQLLWIDVQGSEDQVLKSFDNYLHDVKVIVVELTLQEIYENQPLALDVLNLIRQDFYFVGVLNVGEWQFDAYLVNRNAPHKLRHWFYDKFFSISIVSSRKFGIAREIPRARELVKWCTDKILRLIVDLAVKFLRTSQRQKRHPLSRVFLQMTNVKSKKIADYSRRLVEASLPSNPLANHNEVPSISVVIPVARKDYSRINLTIEKILETSLNPICEITVIYTDDKPPVDQFDDVSIQVLPESVFIPRELEKLVNDFLPERQGWVRQQLLKFLGVEQSASEATLVCDSDTFLTEKRLWVDIHGVQQLQVSHEYSDEYQSHFEKAFDKKDSSLAKISFVTHHQIMQKRIIREMFGPRLEGLSRWLRLANHTSMSPISEYHCYGHYISRQYPEKCVLSQWNNIFIQTDEENIQDVIRLSKGNYSSISIHRYFVEP